MDNALAIKMIPVGYMFKKVARHPDWIVTDNIVDMYSVGVNACIKARIFAA